MDVTNDFDPDAYARPKFNSTILGPDERSYERERNENIKQNALKLSPILKDRVQFIGSNDSLFWRQHRFHNSEECFELQDCDIKAKRMKLEEETTSSFLRSDSKSAEADKENMEMVASESDIPSEKSTRPKGNSTARFHITNPFDSDIMGSLCATTYSPSLFNNSKRNVKCETPEKSFRWSIGQLSDFHPVVIDETESLCQTPNPVEEDQINNAVDKFWASQKFVFPSPYFTRKSTNSEQESSPNLIRRSKALARESPLAFPVAAQFSESHRSVEVQTDFTFPPDFDLIRLLGNHFQYEEDEMAILEADLSLNTLRRKHFIDAFSSQANIEDENEGWMAIDHSYDERELFSDERPAWYHSNDDMVSTGEVPRDDVVDRNEGAEISDRLLSPNISPIKN
ncbi:Protein aurora borealis N-terminus family protein [Acanthocheilonema viteae]|uniref:Protein aurora borealis n=1 Tax=Acanthocheilonema viteae TaxID=6277 RepID=A0A498S9D9_ACAVI|nr:unnamed protein product [Acanthocheilonema viteae]